MRCVRFQDGPPLSVDQQLCRSKKLQVFPLIRHLHYDCISIPLHLDGLKLLFLAGVQRFKETHEE